MESSDTFSTGDRHDPDVCIDMLDYKYIDECDNVKTLEKILRALRTGRDGYYPHLVKHCEGKVAKLNPKSRLLRTEKPILKSRDMPSEEVDQLTEGMTEWIKGMKDSDGYKNGFAEKELPPVRSSGNISKAAATSKKKSERIKGSDFKAWDKFDADEECKKVDDPTFTPVPKNKTEVSDKVDSSKMTAMEKELSAEKEKEKGNEAFKAGDFNEALLYYSRSISVVKSAASINNRALTYLRLKRWTEAENDCDEVLQLEAGNLKAKLRRASALKELARFEEARDDLQFVLEKEANNARAKKLLEEVNSKIKKKGRKMQIVEVDENDDDDDSDCTLPEQKLLQSDSKDNNQESVSKDNDRSASNSVKDEALSPVEQQTSTGKAANHAATVNSEVATVLQDQKPKTPESAEFSKAETDGKSQKRIAGEQSPPRENDLQSSESPMTTPTQANPVIIQEEPKIVHTPLPAEIEKLKVAAGGLFRSGQYATASDEYAKAISRLQTKMQKNSKANYSHALATLYNNRAACKLKSGADKACIADCNKVLEIKPSDLKALIRRASAYEHMEKYGRAYDDFRKAQSIDWTASQAQDGANRVMRHLRELYGPNWREKCQESSSNETVRDITVTPKKDKPEPSVQTVTPSPAKPKTNNAQSTSSLKNNDQYSSVKESKNKVAAETNFRKTEESIIMEEKRARIRRELFAKLKQEGNDLVRKGNYASAVESYTKCIQYCPEQVASYTNRALCFLKLKKYISAIQDCTEAIKLDPHNVKGHFRRAQANKCLKQYHAAEKDLQDLLRFDSANKSAISELSEVKKLIKNSTPKRKIPIQEVSDDEEVAQVEVVTPKRESNISEDSKPIPQEHNSEKPLNSIADNDTPPKDGSLATENKATEETRCSEQDAESTTTSEPGVPAVSPKQENLPLASDNSNDVTIEVPSLPHVPDNLTPYEFGNLWNSIQPKASISAYKCIIDKVAAEDIPAMVSNKITDQMIVMFAQVAARHIDEETVPASNRAYDILRQLSRAQRFEMAAMFLGGADKNTVGETFARLANAIKSHKVAYSFADVNALRSLYSL